MKYISHRGNLDGRMPQFENDPAYILEAISAGYDVEIDLHSIGSYLYLSHDIDNEYSYVISEDFLLEYHDKLWIHAKTYMTVNWLLDMDQDDPKLKRTGKLNWFWHENDKLSVTSHGWIWTSRYDIPGRRMVFMDIKSNQNEIFIPIWTPQFLHGVCSDYITLVEKKYEPSRI